MKFFLPVFVCKFLKSIVALVKATINTINRIIIFYVLREIEKVVVAWNKNVPFYGVSWKMLKMHILISLSYLVTSC